MIAWTINARREAWRQIRLFPTHLPRGQPFDIETLACLILVGKAELLRIVPIGRDDQGAFIAVSNRLSRRGFKILHKCRPNLLRPLVQL